MVIFFKKHIIIFLLGFLALSACKTKKIEGDTGTLRKLSTKKIIKNLDRNNIKADWLSLKSNITTTSKDGRQKFTAYIRNKKDEAIWMSIRMLGIEGARVLIRPDSIFILNRLNKEYIARDFGFIDREFGLPVDFYKLQSALVGNPVYFNDSKLKSDIDAKNYTLSSDNNDLSSKYWIDGVVFVLNQMHFLDANVNQEISFGYEDYQKTIDKQVFSYFRTIDLDSQQTGKLNISLKLSKVELNKKKELDFEIPSSYQKK